jgi:hypothetical protein
MKEAKEIITLFGAHPKQSILSIFKPSTLLSISPDHFGEKTIKLF